MVKRPALPPGPVADLNMALYGLYRAAGAPSMERIRDRIRELATEADENGKEVSDPTATPSHDTVHAVLTAPTPPTNVNNVIAVTAALLHPQKLMGEVSVVRGHPQVEEIRRLWAAAVAYVPLGRLLTEVPAQHLEVRRTLPPGAPDEGPLPAYIPRAHDLVLHGVAAAALADTPRSGIAVLLSDSTSGKTRALFELLHHPVLAGTAARGQRKPPPRSLAKAGWRVWPPINPIPARRFLQELPGIGPRTVIWLNEAQRYLIDPDSDTAEAIAIGLRELLADPARTPVLVLGTLWPRYLDEITAASSSSQDAFAAARALLAGHTIAVPGTFTGADLDVARVSTDTRIQDALATADTAVESRGHAREVSLTQHMAGVPALLDFYRTASTTIGAVLHAAMDARRLGHSEWLPVDLLRHAAVAYLTPQQQRHHLADREWFIHALKSLTTPLQTAAARVFHQPLAIPGHPTGDLVRLEDYLDQHGRSERACLLPPSGFWVAAATHANTADLNTLGDAAWNRGLYRDASRLHKHATVCGDLDAAGTLVEHLWLVAPSDRRPADWVARNVLFEDMRAAGSFLFRLQRFFSDAQIRVVADRAAMTVALDDPSAVSYLVDALHRVGATRQVDSVASHAASGIALDNPGDVSRLLAVLSEIGATGQVQVLARRAAAGIALDSAFDVNRLLALLSEIDAAEQVRVLARRATTGIALNDSGGVRWLAQTMYSVGAADGITELLGRAASGVGLDNPTDVGWLLQELHQLGATEQVRVLASRIAAGIALDNSTEVGWLLDTLVLAGTTEQARVLADRVATELALDAPETLGRRLRMLHRFGASDLVRVLLSRAGTGVAPTDPSDAARLLEALHEIGATDQMQVLADRIIANVSLGDLAAVAQLLQAVYEIGTAKQFGLLADRIATEVALHDMASVDWFLLKTLRRLGAAERVDVLARRATAGIGLDAPAPVAELLRVLDQVGAVEQVHVLADNAATGIALDDPAELAELLHVLHEVNAVGQLHVLAKRAAINIALDNPRGMGRLLVVMHRIVGADQSMVLAARNPSAQVELKPDGVAELLQALYLMGANDQVQVLADRVATGIALDHPFSVELLPHTLFNIGAANQSTRLIHRFPAAAMFRSFLKTGDHADRFQFGREREGAPSAQWTWDDLE